MLTFAALLLWITFPVENAESRSLSKMLNHVPYQKCWITFLSKMLNHVPYRKCSWKNCRVVPIHHLQDTPQLWGVCLSWTFTRFGVTEENLVSSNRASFTTGSGPCNGERITVMALSVHYLFTIMIECCCG